MDKAKEAVSGFLHKSGNKDTTVHETIAPAVTQETVVPTRREEVSTAVDKEVHQDHYHTSVQPVKDQEVLPEKHVHQVAGVEERAVQHGSGQDDEALRAREAAQFKDTRYVAPTQHSAGAAQAVEGEHVHHHVYETIQPVVNKQTVAPEVVHTVNPVHEVHQNESIHHGTTQLPEMTRAEMEAKGIPHGGRDARYDSFQGEPRLASGAAPAIGSTGTTGTTGTSGMTSTTGTTGMTSTTGNTGMTSTSGTTETTGTSGIPSGTTGAPGYSSGSTEQWSNTQSTEQKATLLDKLNPKKDATGDGQAGFMK